MRILLLTSSMSSGGAERVACTLANAWALRGDEIMLMPTFSGRGECFYQLSPYVKLIYLADLVARRSKSFLNKIMRLHALRRFISTESPDVIISFLSNVNVAAVVASAGLGIPIIICERIDPFVVPLPHTLRLACRIIYPFSDALTVQTQAVASKYAASYRTLQTVRVIPNPIPQSIMDIQHRANVNDKMRLLAVGRLSEQKQFGVLINAFSRLALRYAHVSLRIVGEGPLRPFLQQQINSLGLEERIEMPGLIQDIGKELAEADVFVLTSAYEGFPNVLLEAMAFGLPCVTFDCPSGPREISMDGLVAMLVPLNDEQAVVNSIERLILDADLRQDLGTRARVSVMERFSLHNVLGQWDLLFNEVGVKSCGGNI